MICSRGASVWIGMSAYHSCKSKSRKPTLLPSVKHRPYFHTVGIRVFSADSMRSSKRMLQESHEIGWPLKKRRSKRSTTIAKRSLTSSLINSSRSDTLQESVRLNHLKRLQVKNQCHISTNLSISHENMKPWIKMTLARTWSNARRRFF